MPYSTPAMVRNAVAPGDWAAVPPQTPGGTGTAADMSDQQLSDEIAEADTQIDVALAPYYLTPVAPVEGLVPHPIDYWSRNIAAYNATLTNNRNLPVDPNSPVALRYMQTMTAMKGLANGSTVLEIPSLNPDTTGGGAGAPLNPYEGTMFFPSDFDLIERAGPFPPFRDYYPRRGY